VNTTTSGTFTGGPMRVWFGSSSRDIGRCMIERRPEWRLGSGDWWAATNPKLPTFSVSCASPAL
jgi:hypothetical protein